MNDLRIQFGKRLRHLRRERDLTQEQIAEAAGISVDMLSNMERGVNAPSFETLEKLARVLRGTDPRSCHVLGRGDNFMRWPLGCINGCTVVGYYLRKRKA